jgi:Holliday junction resolvasome RuvABC endonuclease subunit
MIVAGIDPSLTATGIAILDNGNPIALAKIGYPGHDGASDPDRMRRVAALVLEIRAYTRQHKPDLVIIERPAYSQNTGSACDRHCLWGWLVHEFAIAGPERYAGIAPTSRASFATGKNHGSKQQVIDAVTQWWPEHRLRLRDDNIADAATLAAMGALWAGDPMPFEPKERHHTRIEAIAWPVIA